MNLTIAIYILRIIGGYDAKIYLALITAAIYILRIIGGYDLTISS